MNPIHNIKQKSRHRSSKNFEGACFSRTHFSYTDTSGEEVADNSQTGFYRIFFFLLGFRIAWWGRKRTKTRILIRKKLRNGRLKGNWRLFIMCFLPFPGLKFYKMFHYERRQQGLANCIKLHRNRNLRVINFSILCFREIFWVPQSKLRLFGVEPRTIKNGSKFISKAVWFGHFSNHVLEISELNIKKIQRLCGS